jgi:epoxide hydrolase
MYGEEYDTLYSSLPHDTSTIHGELDARRIHSLTVSVPQDVLNTLRARLLATRWPEKETVNDWSQGVPLTYLQDLCGYWADGYNWRVTEQRINALPNFWTVIDNLRIHFIHVRSKTAGARPLILTHGWPGSVMEFLKVIAPLTDPEAHGGTAEDAFDVILPSLPGFGFSERPHVTGWGADRVADAWVELMSRLGYSSFFAQGGDIGAMVTSSLGSRHPAHVLGIHLNMVVVSPDPDTMTDITEAEKDDIARWDAYLEWDSGYAKLQSTRPQTIGYGLVDSPIAQCAWIVEKFQSWMDCNGDPTNVVSNDELLDNVMLYWLTGTGASAARMYWERHAVLAKITDQVFVPTACSIFPKELRRPSRKWAECTYRNICSWNELSSGGHFPAFEQPDVFVDELRSAFRTMA